ncbi:MAG TPA: RimK-like ATPgrasp N-terminal domain-containing protein, partial [Spongiibacteraceae bacterium]|nr:RimK-like ATPgrasp N-terminal domain-containing protein [Spongiibacteraceae bacterium]
MARLIIVVDSLKDWGPYFPSDNVMSFEDYLKLRTPRGERVRVINLCRSYRYLSKGYYCALLAEARDHRVTPSVRTINELRQQERIPPSLAVLPDPIQKRLKETLAGQTSVTFTAFLGEAEEHLAALARHVFELLALPLAEITLSYTRKWRIESIKPRSISSLDDTEQTRFAEAMERFNQRIWRKPKTKRMRYSMAMLVNPKEKMPPSDAKALQ